jgi:hypothetical protein
MLDLDTAKKQISTWIDTVLTEPQAELNGISRCPFAATALANDRVAWALGSDVASDVESAMDNWQHHLEIAVIVYDPSIDPAAFAIAVESANHHICQPRSFIALEDHPAVPERVAGLSMNQGQYALLLLTPAAKLHRASQMLRARGYYDNWSQQDLDTVVNWRWSC